MVASWYPEGDVIGLVKACAAILPIPGDIYETMGAAGAKGHLEGIYAHLLGRDLNARAHTLWKTQHDSGELSVSATTPDSATYTLSGWDHASREYCRLLGAYFVEVHRLDGAAEPSVVHPKCRAAAARPASGPCAGGSPEATLRAGEARVPAQARRDGRVDARARGGLDRRGGRAGRAERRALRGRAAALRVVAAARARRRRARRGLRLGDRALDRRHLGPRVAAGRRRSASCARSASTT